eukprot:3686346-Prymnesium_polylepis.1
MTILERQHLLHQQHYPAIEHTAREAPVRAVEDGSRAGERVRPLKMILPAPERLPPEPHDREAQHEQHGICEPVDPIRCAITCEAPPCPARVYSPTAELVDGKCWGDASRKTTPGRPPAGIESIAAACEASAQRTRAASPKERSVRRLIERERTITPVRPMDMACARTSVGRIALV